MSPEQEADEAARARAGQALSRLHSFAVLYGPGEVIDETSNLTSDDLNVLLGMLEVAVRAPGR